MFFRRNFDQQAAGGEAPPEKKGPGRFFEIIQQDSFNLLKLNLLFLVSCLPVVTLPPALFAMNQVIRRMVQDQPVQCLSQYRSAFRRYAGRSYAAFLLVVLPLAVSGFGALFYLDRAVGNLLFFLPFMFCSTVFLVTLLASTYLYGLLASERAVGQAVRLALTLGMGRPLRALLAVLLGYGLALGTFLAIPISVPYLLLIGFSLPCLLSNFFVRTVLKPYC